MKEFFNPLLECDLVQRGRVNTRRLASMPFADLYDVVDAVADSTSNRATLGDISGLIHCASVPMSGGSGECAAIGCRSARVDQLSRFVALYSDATYFHNFLADLAPSFGHPPDEDSADARKSLAEDLTVLLQMKPLIDAGLLVPFSTPQTYCPACLAKIHVGNAVGGRVEAALNTLSQELLEEMQIEIEHGERGYVFGCKTDRNIYGHAWNYLVRQEPPKALLKRPGILKRIQSGKSVTASKSLRKDLRINFREAQGILYRALYQMAVAQSTGAAPLTYRQVDIDAIQLLTAHDEKRRQNSILYSNLKAVVPYAEDVPINQLVALRKREREAFLRFRAALRQTINEVAGEGYGLSEGMARTLYADVLAPEVARLEQAVKKAKRDLVRTPAITVLGAAGAIAFGTYTGLLPLEYMAIGTTLGLTKVAQALIEKTAKLSDTTSAIREEKFFYLWKVRHAARAAGSEH